MKKHLPTEKLRIAIKWLIPKIAEDPARHALYNKCMEHWFSKIHDHSTHSGELWAVKRVKSIRSITLQFIAGNPVHAVKEFISIDKRGLPEDLGPLKQLACSRDKQDLRYLMTLLTVTKAYTGPIVPNFASITDPYTGTDDMEGWDVSISRTFRWLKVKKSSLTCDFTGYHLSTKASPDGKNAIVDSLSEVLKLKSMSLMESICNLGGKLLESKIYALSSNLDPSKIRESTTLRTLSAIPDKEGKTRLIAKLDYWSQSSLKPLHEELMKLLRKFPSDCTFNQGSFTRDLKPGTWFSFDLKDATDRFPIALQQKVLSYLIGEDKAKSWSTILTHTEYTFKGSQATYKYAVGQPMGAYSSWAAFALTHHIVVQRAAMEVEKFPFNEYYLLGDDIVICSIEVAHKYEELMQKLGVSFSPTKTFKSDKLFEFASRIFYGTQPQEISPFTLSGLMEAYKEPSTIVEFLHTMHSHGWEIFKCGNTPGQILNLMKLLGSPAFPRWGQIIHVLNVLPFSRIVSPEDLPSESLEITGSLSCFKNQHKPRIRDALIVEIAKALRTGLERVTETQFEWGLALGTGRDSFRSVSGNVPVDSLDVPIFGVFQDLRTKVHSLAREVEVYVDMYVPDSIPPFEEWISKLVDISNPPSFQKAKIERRTKQITMIKSSLIQRALVKARRGDLI
jgi:hypothetical protein